MTETTATPDVGMDDVFIPPALQDRVFLPIKDTCRALGGIGRSTLYRKIREGTLNLDIYDMSGRSVCRVDQVCTEAARLPKVKLQREAA